MTCRAGFVRPVFLVPLALLVAPMLLQEAALP